MLLIEQERKRFKLSQAKLAQRADMHPSSVCAIERGNLIPFQSQRDKLVKALRAEGWDGDEVTLFEEVAQ
jgi:ribosome-binding protein aMBF1 (putative translation factor)